jgi:hypothetical protein
MRRTTTALATLLLAATLTACSQSREDTVAACTNAVEQLAEGDADRPKACNELTEDDYLSILVNVRARKIGLLDENGDPNPDMSKLNELTED